MIAVAAEDGGGGQQWQRQTTSAANNNGMQDWAANYDREGQEWAARDGGDIGVAMTAASVEDGGSGQ
jgi:hypothetical protein